MDRRARTQLALAACCAVLFALVVLAAYVWGPGRSADLAGLTGFVSLNDGWVQSLTGRLLDFGDPAQVALITLVLFALSVLRGRPRVALGIVALMATTSISSQLLKIALAHPRWAPILGHVVGPEALPSGHATAAMALAFAGVLAVPRRARIPAALLGSGLAVAVGASVIAWGWHYPSDVLAGYLLATGWALVIAAALQEADRWLPARDRSASAALARASDRVATVGLTVTAVVAVGLAGLVGIVAIAVDPSGASCFAREHTSFVAVAGALTAAAVALPVTMATVVRRG
jgi:membrane-associated phospholipid phosphatase